MFLLEIKDLHVFYGDYSVLKGISLSVNEGEILSIVGANSAGKSTLLKAISAEIPTERGDILFNNISIVKLSPHMIARKGIIQVPEGRRIFPFMTVLENLLVGSTLPEARRNRPESISKIFTLFPILKERQTQLGGTLSGGEQQMLAIGRGLMSLPTLLMLDEPSIGLAPIMVESIFKVIRTINDQKITILLVEQNVQKSLSAADRAYVLEGGELAMEGIGKDLLQNPHIKKAYLGIA